ncbi:MAG: DUF6797 domain-containing protein [Verrucomicrobiota bacterium]
MRVCNARVILEYDADASSRPTVTLFGNHEIALPVGNARRVELAVEHLEGRPAHLRVWHEGKLVEAGHDLEGTMTRSGPFVATPEESRNRFRLDRDFTAIARFRTEHGGTLFAKALPEGEWVPDAKALFIRGGRLVYDIGWLGELVGKRKVNDGREHVAVVVVEDGKARLMLDGRVERSRSDFQRPDEPDHVFKLESASTDFGGDYQGDLLEVRFWNRALPAGELGRIGRGESIETNTPDFHWTPPTSEEADAQLGTSVTLKAGAGFRLSRSDIQPLALSDHAALVAAWDDQAVERGREIYHQLCVTCHGTLKTPGSLPTALRFHEGPFKNGADPYRMFQTLEKGYGMMVAQPQYSTAEKYDLIHYLREEFLRDHNPSQLTPVDADYLELLPRGMTLRKEAPKAAEPPPYLAMDFGNALFWTLQVEDGNIAQKGITLRVDHGPGGISKGQAWMLYDHDTMRLAACWTGDRFIDWRGIAFDGSHGTHASIVGEKHFVFPNQPMWEDPVHGGFEDNRIRGRDGKPYGPLPREWLQFEGIEPGSNGETRLHYRVGECSIVEIPLFDAQTSTFARLLQLGPSSHPLVLKVNRDQRVRFPPSRETRYYAIKCKGTDPTEISPDPALREFFQPEVIPARRFPGTLTTTIDRGEDNGPFAVDELNPPAPAKNPWQSWMRTSGLDFFADGRRAALCTWNGDVWIVEGIDQSEGDLTWRRICAGLFQPLGLRIVDDRIFVSCRDMIARLDDRNGDGETDFIRCFNNDHQVTEHFHEFAMGLQTDEAGNFYYAKSARHGLPAVIPHHGTLLRVSPEGHRTDILATGFRAANGVCLNPDGTFIVTDQEGHWNPKNRINWVRGSGPDDFYGNMFGYHDVTDSSDEAMRDPLCWITNAFDRSPAELLWVPDDADWGPLNGSLLNLSYGAGKIYVVPHESIDGVHQGGMCPLPIEALPTGVMRGRFHPDNGQLYACGMFAWAGNRREPGGFYRIRATGKPMDLPLKLEAARGSLRITFSDPLDAKACLDPERYRVEAWDLKRSKRYGSKHQNQQRWAVTSVSLSPDGKTFSLEIPELAPTWSMSVSCDLLGADGREIQRVIHNTIHALGKR